MEAGERWTLTDVADNVRYGWDSREHRRRTTYDVLGRPADVHLKTGGEPERLVGRTEYGESHPDSAAHNLRGQPYRTFDGAGVVTIAEYDFKANALTSTRHLTADYTSLQDWSTDVALEPDVFTTDTTFDALNRPITMTTPDMSIVRRTYNEAGLLEAIDANVRGAAMEGEPVWTSFVRGTTR
jgi:YD repeat-containing protein